MQRFSRLCQLLAAVLLAELLSGCLADEVGGVYMVTEKVDTLQAVADQKADILFYAGGTWTAKSTDNWLEITPETGNGGRNMVTVRSKEPNHTRELRKTQVIIMSDGKSKTIEVVQRDEFALFKESEYIVEPEGGEVNIGFTTNVERGRLYVSYLKFDWYSIADAPKKTRVEVWDGQIRSLTVQPNNTPEPRSAKFILGIYDERKIFMPLDSTWVRQKGSLTP